MPSIKKILIKKFGIQRFELIKAATLLPALLRDSVYDFSRFLRSRLNTEEIIRARITMDYHRIEKGLALKDTRIGFGQETVMRLIDNLYAYNAIAGVDTLVTIAVQTLAAYSEFHAVNGGADPSLETKIAELRKICQTNVRHADSGYKWVDKREVHEQAVCDLSPFFLSRYSVRDFSEQEVALKLVERAMQMAVKTPSVCNRQAWRVYLFHQKDDILKVLALQNGNRGFREQVPLVAVVTCDRSAFVTPDERNQAWVDGGMFSMSLVYALHSLGLGSCCLNWSVGKSQDVKLKQLTGIPETDAVIMMIAIGHLPETFKVACSPRKEVHTFLKINSLS